MAWCRQAPSHYQSLCWPSSMMPWHYRKSPWTIQVREWSTSDATKYIVILCIKCTGWSPLVSQWRGWWARGSTNMMSHNMYCAATWLHCPKLRQLQQALKKYRQTSSITCTKSRISYSKFLPNHNTYMFLTSSCSCCCPIQWSQVLSQEWRCSWSSACRRWSNYIWVINNFTVY